MKTVLFLLSFLFVQVASSNDILFNRLSKLYNTNPDKCLDAAERYIHYFPNECSSYFYASKVNFDRSKKVQNQRTAYSLLKKSISYAVKFEKSDHEKIEKRVNWSETKQEMKKFVVQLSNELSEGNQQSLSASLMISFSKLDQTTDFIQVPKEDPLAVAPKVNPTESTNGFMFGMPQGNENVKSSNVSEEKELLRMINVEREKMGLEPLIWEENLARAARYHAFDLGSQRYFDHNSYDRIDGKLVKVGGTFARIGRFYQATSLNSENIAAGSKHAAGTYEQWYTSKGHYDNMFNSKSKKVGIGYFIDENAPYKYYWVFCTAL